MNRKQIELAYQIGGNWWGVAEITDCVATRIDILDMPDHVIYIKNECLFVCLFSMWLTDSLKKDPHHSTQITLEEARRLKTIHLKTHEGLEKFK